MAILLRLTPAFTVGRSQSGTVAVDPASLTLQDYPLDQIMQPGAASEVAFYWRAEGAVPADTLDIEVLLLDTTNNRYIVGETFSTLSQQVVVSNVQIYACPFTLRVTAVSAGSVGKNLQLWVARTLPPPMRLT